MRCLLDTHALLWWLDADHRLSPTATEIIGDSRTEVFVSVASAWEIAIKAGIGRLDLPDDLAGFFERQLETNGFDLLTIELRHALAVRDLPNHHRDPFDRLLIVQARAAELVLISSDSKLRAYDVETCW